MARKKKEFPPAKERFISFRVTEELYGIIESEASLAKMSVSEYCRNLAAHKKIVIKNVKDLSIFTGERHRYFGKIGKSACFHAI